MFANGLLYSSQICNYTKLLVKMCNINEAEENNTCANLTEIASMSAKGRIFLFIEDMPDNSSVSK